LICTRSDKIPITVSRGMFRSVVAIYFPLWFSKDLIRVSLIGKIPINSDGYVIKKIPRPTYKPHSVQWWLQVYIPKDFLPATTWVIIYLGHASQRASCSLPGIRMERVTPHPCLALLLVGVARSRTLLPRRWSLTPPFHPYGSTLCRTHGFELGGMFLWPDPRDCSLPDVIRHHTLWSADFPHRKEVPLHCDHPVDLGYYDVTIKQLESC